MATDTEKFVAAKCLDLIRADIKEVKEQSGIDLRVEEILDEIIKQHYGDRHKDREKFCRMVWGHALKNLFVEMGRGIKR